jgi:hypothetical protein
MPLENAQYIPELVPSNPLGVDPVNLGDNHLRVIKTAVLGSFPGFVGTQVTPKFVTLTEDELNALIDAALKAGAATISGLWDFTTPPTINGDAVATEPFATAADLVLQNILQRPTERVVSGNDTIVQDDQGLVVRYTGTGGDTITLPTLLLGTELTIKNAGGGAITIANANMTWLDGLGGTAPTGDRTLQRSSVTEVHYTSTTDPEIWGNGLS